MKLRREIAAVPLRTGAEAWTALTELIAKPGSVDSGQLTAAATVMATLLSEDHYARHPLTLTGDGHRLVIYFSYGADALTLGEAVDPLSWNPTSKDWTLFTPCHADDLDWVKDTLAKRAPRLRVHGLDETLADLQEEEEPAARSAGFVIDWSAARP